MLRLAFGGLLLDFGLALRALPLRPGERHWRRLFDRLLGPGLSGEAVAGRRQGALTGQFPQRRSEGSPERGPAGSSRGQVGGGRRRRRRRPLGGGGWLGR
uniref:Putative secreted protein n=1 Tax=Ixodes ricinus TaxID=34613 RepID=A0A6B0UIA6_IXORI